MARKRGGGGSDVLPLVIIGGGLLIWWLLKTPAAQTGPWGLLDIYRMPDGSLVTAWQGCPPPQDGLLVGSLTIGFAAAGQSIPVLNLGSVTVPAVCPTAQTVPAPPTSGLLVAVWRGCPAPEGAVQIASLFGVSLALAGQPLTLAGLGTITLPAPCPATETVGDGLGILDIYRISSNGGTGSGSGGGTGALIPGTMDACGHTLQTIAGGAFPTLQQAGLAPVPGTAKVADLYSSRVLYASGISYDPTPSNQLDAYMSGGTYINSLKYPEGQGQPVPMNDSRYPGWDRKCSQIVVGGAAGFLATVCQATPGDSVQISPDHLAQCDVILPAIEQGFPGRYVLYGKDGRYYVTPQGHLWLPIPDSSYSGSGSDLLVAVPQISAGVPAGDYGPILQTGHRGDVLWKQIGDLIQSGQFEKTLRAIIAEKEMAGGNLFSDISKALGLAGQITNVVMGFMSLLP